MIKTTSDEFILNDFGMQVRTFITIPYPIYFSGLINYMEMSSLILPAILKNIAAKCAFALHDLIKIIQVLNGATQNFFIQKP